MTSQMNAPQRAAVRYLDGPLLVLAGAGSGKTRVITEKIAYLIQRCELSASHIAALTFTNKAAREMQQRLDKLLPKQSKRGLIISTFHALGLLILRQESRVLGYKSNFSLLDTADVNKLAAELLNSTDKALVKQVLSRISSWKSAMASPAEAQAAITSAQEQLAANFYQVYQKTLSAYQAFDFDDLIALPVRLFTDHLEVQQKWQQRLRYLLIDEYQDTNACQYQLLRLIAGERGQFTAVGDDDQAIYGWRGADADNLSRLSTHFPTLKVIKLEQNYRSSRHILSAANRLIAHNTKIFDKTLWSEHAPGELIHIIAAVDEEQEAEMIVTRLLAHKFEMRTRFSDYAILYRSNYQARTVEKVLRQHKVAYQMSGGQSFFDRTEIKDIVGYLRIIANSDDDPAFIRTITTPKRGVGAQTLESLGRYAAERQASLFDAAYESGFESQMGGNQLEALQQFCQFITRMQFRATREPATQVLNDLLQAIDFEGWLYHIEEPRTAQAKWENIQEFVRWVTRKTEDIEEADPPTLIELAQRIALMARLEDKEDLQGDKVKLSTLHASKGLEFPHVFLMGVEEEVLPHRESIDSGKVEEERRLLYVGLTRAQRSLTLSYTEKRKHAGEWRPVQPSRFIEEMGEAGIQHIGRANVDKEAAKGRGSQQLAVLKALLKQRDRT